MIDWLRGDLGFSTGKQYTEAVRMSVFVNGDGMQIECMYTVELLAWPQAAIFLPLEQ